MAPLDRKKFGPTDVHLSVELGEKALADILKASDDEYYAAYGGAIWDQHYTWGPSQIKALKRVSLIMERNESSAQYQRRMEAWALHDANKVLSLMHDAQNAKTTNVGKARAFRDMIVTHLLQVLAFVVMEPPTSFSAKALVNETVKVFESMHAISPDDVVFGQYDGYRRSVGVAPDSETETYVAARVFVDNWRWAGVPLYLRTGKRMAQTRRLLTIAFRDPPRRMFESANGHPPNKIVFDLSDRGGVQGNFLAKVPGPTMSLAPARFKFDYDDSFGSEMHELEAYERLIHDALIGDRSLFTRPDGLAAVWKTVTPLLTDPPRVASYPPGSWGPAAARKLIAPGRWLLGQ